MTTYDSAWLEEVYRELNDEVFRTIRKQGLSVMATEDIVHDTFVRAWERIDSYSPDKPFKPWILKIAYNLAMNWHRRYSKEESFDPLEEYDWPNTSSSPETLILEREREEITQQSLDRIPPRNAQIARLTYGLADGREYTYHELTSLGWSVSMLAKFNRQTRALLRKQQILHEYINI